MTAPDAGSSRREEILALVARYAAEELAPPPFVAGETTVPVSGRVFDGAEVMSLVDASLDFWLTTGRFADAFEARFAAVMGAGAARLCNSGSSANLLAAAALTSPALGDEALVAGDEVITCASGFPTTVTPLYQQGLVPVYVDVDLATLNLDPSALEAAIGPRTRAVMVAHTLGNPFAVDAVRAVCERHGLWLVEDCCDAVGSTFGGSPVGSFGALATTSFYPAHHITMGEGGCVLVNQPRLERIVESFRDWGRDCWCAPGAENTCGRRFGWQLGDLPFGYDHKYVYSHLGYNLKLTDMQAAVGVAQLDKLPGFVQARKDNWQRVTDGIADLEGLSVVTATPRERPRVVRRPDARRRGRAVRSLRPRRSPRVAPYRDPARVRGQPAPPARVRRARAPSDRRPRSGRRRGRARALARVLSRSHARDARLRRGDLARLRGRTGAGPPTPTGGP